MCQRRDTVLLSMHHGYFLWDDVTSGHRHGLNLGELSPDPFLCSLACCLEDVSWMLLDHEVQTSVLTQPQPMAMMQVPQGVPPAACPAQQITTVVVNTAPPSPTMATTWSSGLFQCMDDIPLCLFGAFGIGLGLPCYIAHLYGETCCLGFFPGAVFAMRSGMRERFKIAGSILNDYCTVCLCYQCALCQMGRQIKNYNWQMKRQRHGIVL